MNTIRRIALKLAKWGGRAAILLVFSIGVTVLLLWLAGNFAPKVSAPPKRVLASDDKAPGSVAGVRLVRLPLVETAVGTIRPVHETTIGAKLLARVVEVNLKAGQVVKAGDVLARLDDTDLLARRRQAEAVLNAAEAARIQAESDAIRSTSLLRPKP
jgi:multidrug efflux pump subunit AcrA (membrane-fusion protein)